MTECAGFWTCFGNALVSDNVAGIGRQDPTDSSGNAGAAVGDLVTSDRARRGRSTSRRIGPGRWSRCVWHGRRLSRNCACRGSWHCHGDSRWHDSRSRDLGAWLLTLSRASKGADGAYKRPSNATTPEQREAVQGKPCSTCGANGQKNVADHKVPLVVEHYTTGTINKQNMRSIGAVQPQCSHCSNQRGGLPRVTSQSK